MNKKILVIFVSLLAVAMLIMLLSVVFATKPDIAVSGGMTWTGSPTFDYYKEKPHGAHMTGVNPVMFTGSFYGPSDGEFVWNLHTKGGPRGPVSGNCVHTITVLAFEGDETKIGTISILISNANSRGRILSGTGFFENLHGTLTFRPDESTEYPYDHLYSGTVHFDP